MIQERSPQIAALQAGQIDLSPPGWSRVNAEQAKQSAPKLVFIDTSSNVSDNVLVNFKRAPFTDLRVRRAVNLAFARKAYVQALGRVPPWVAARGSPRHRRRGAPPPRRWPALRGPGAR